MKQVNAYADEKGTLHSNPQDALIADLSLQVFGTADRALAHVVVEKREVIEKLFKEYDNVVAPPATVKSIPN